MNDGALSDLNLPESLYYHMVGGPRPDNLNRHKFRSPSYQVNYAHAHEGAFCQLFVRLSSATSFEPISGNIDVPLG